MINQKFDYLYAENGRLKAVVVDKNGEPQVTDVTPDKPYSQSLITDGQGDTLVVSKKGQVMGVKEYKFAGDDRHLLNEYHRQLDSLGDWQINFNSAKEKQTYAFDQIGSGEHGIFATDEYYPKSGSYDFRYKSVECGKNDKVIVEFDTYPEKDSVVFKDKYGVTYPVSLKDNVLSFTGVSKADTNFIYAYRGDKKIGKLFLNTYKQKTYKVVFVKVNGAAKKVNEKDIEKYLNKVYNQCAVKFEITHEEFSFPELTSFSHGGSGILTVYNDDQKKVLQAYEKEKKMTDGVFYLFFIDNVTDKKDGSGTPVSGYMPRGYNAGFIYDGGSERTIAHELGHGVAGLEHVFENSSNSGKTANLMDYANGEELWHSQWDQIQDPSRVWMKWNKDESEGEVITKDMLFEQINSNENNFTFNDKDNRITCIAPSGKPITLPDNVYVISFISRFDFVPDGTVSWFNTSDGKTFVANYITDTHYFKGYVQVSNYDAINKKYDFVLDDNNEKVYYVDDYSKNLSQYNGPVTIGINKLCALEFYQIEYQQIDEKFKNDISSEKYHAAGNVCLQALDYQLDPKNVLFTINDDEGCSLVTDYAKEFYEKAIDNVNVSQRSVILRIARLFDKIAQNKSLDQYEMKVFFDNFTPKYFADANIWDLALYDELEKSLNAFLTSKEDMENEIKACTSGHVFEKYGLYLTNYRKSANYKIHSHVIKVASSLIFTEFVQDWVLNAIKSINENDYDAFLSDLKENNNQLMQKLTAKFDGEDYTQFVDAILQIYTKANEVELLKQDVNEFKNTNPNNCFTWKKEFSADKNIRIIVDYKDNKLDFAVQYGYVLDFKTKNHRGLIDPFDLVLLHFSTVPDFVAQFQQVQNGDDILLPAFVLQWMCNEHQNQEIKKYVIGTVCIAGLFVGVGIAAGGGAVAKEVITYLVKEKGKAFVEAFVQELIAGVISSYLDAAFTHFVQFSNMNNFNFLDTDIAKNTVTSWAYYEGAFKNAVSSLTSNIEFSNKYGDVEKFAKILNECVNGSNIGIENLIEREFWTEKGQIQIWSGCIYNIVKGVILQNMLEKPKVKRWKKSGKRVVGLIAQVFVDFINKATVRYGEEVVDSFIQCLINDNYGQTEYKR